MDERVVQFRVGVMVLATIIIAVILVLLFGESPWHLGTGSYTIYIRFPDAPGVTKGTPIRKSGILIGEVTDVRFSDDNEGVIITAQIDSQRKIPRSDVCRITSSLLGDATLEFISPKHGEAPGQQLPAGNVGGTSPQTSADGAVPIRPASYQKAPAPAEDQKRRFLGPGETVRGVVSPDPIQVVANLQESLSQAISSVARTSDDLGALVHQVTGLLNSNEQRINRILVQTDRTTALFEQTLTNINKLVGDDQTRQQLAAAIKEAPALLRDTRDTVNKMGQTMSLLDKNLENIAGFTGPLGEQGPILMTRLDKSAEKLDTLLGELLVFSQSLNNPKGSLGRLVNDPELYENISRAVENVEELTTKLRPVVDDARVFSDKIARHPEVLGVRGAIQRNPGIK